MKPPRSITHSVRTGLLLVCFGAAPTIGAEPTAARPEAGSIPLPVQQEQVEIDAESDRAAPAGHGMVRLWNFTDRAADSGLGVFLGRPGDSPPPENDRVWLARGFRNGERKDYRGVRSGRYELYVVPDASRQGAMVAIPENILPETLQLPARTFVTVGEGTYQTLLFRAAGGRIAVESLRDDEMDPSVRTLRVWNLLPDITPTVSRIEGDRRSILVRSLGTETQSVALPTSSRLVVLEISHPLPGGATARWNAEADFSSVRSCSLLLYRDRYGRAISSVAADAPLLPTSTPNPLP